MGFVVMTKFFDNYKKVHKALTLGESADTIDNQQIDDALKVSLMKGYVTNNEMSGQSLKAIMITGSNASNAELLNRAKKVLDQNLDTANALNKAMGLSQSNKTETPKPRNGR